MIRYTVSMQKKPRLLLFAAGLVAGVVVTAPLYMTYATKNYIVSSVNAAPTSTVALVLGASVIRGEPSPALQARAEVALKLYQAGKVEKILVTGDDSVPGFDEVTPVRRFLEAEGVAAEDIFLDHAGYDTYTSMHRARNVFSVHDALIVTQGFHMPRSIFIARHLGLDARGVVAEERGDPIYNYTREWLASVKAAGDLVFRRVPTHIGEQFPITGNGEDTWDE